MSSLITAWEVVRYSPEDDNFPTAKVEPFIETTEETVRRKWLGEDFYDALLSDKASYTATVWDSTATYAANDYVDYYGVILRSKTNSNTTAPCDDNGTDWAEVSKFSTACYNTLWTKYLRRYLAFIIMSKALKAVTYQAGAQGVTKYLSEDTRVVSVTLQELEGKTTHLLKEADEILENMREWIKDTYTDYSNGVSSASGCSGLSSANCVAGGIQQTQRPRKRFNFRTSYEYYENPRNLDV